MTWCVAGGLAVASPTMSFQPLMHAMHAPQFHVWLQGLGISGCHDRHRVGNYLSTYSVRSMYKSSRTGQSSVARCACIVPFQMLAWSRDGISSAVFRGRGMEH